MDKFDFNKAVQEAINTTSGYTSSSMPDSCGFVYQVLPLSFDLLQTGRTRKVPKEAKDQIKLYNGDHIEGLSIYDKKKHKGNIQRILYKDTKPLVGYIVDDETSEIIPILLSSARKLKKA